MRVKIIIVLAVMMAAALVLPGAKSAKANHQVQLQVFLIDVKEPGSSRKSKLPVTVLLEPMKRNRASDNVCRLSPRVRDGILGFFNGKTFTTVSPGKVDAKDIAKQLQPVVAKSLGKYKSFVTNVDAQQGMPYVSGSAATMFNKQGCMTAPHPEEIERREQEKKEKAAKQKSKKKKK